MSNAKQVKAVDPLINGLPSGSFNLGDGVNYFQLHTQSLLELLKMTLSTAADLNETSLEQSMIDIAK